jgi:preprotein translocase SecE subunit
VSDAAPGAGKPARPSRGGARIAGGGLRIYKPGQGYYTRVGTAIGTGVLILAGSVFLFTELGASISPKATYALPVKYGVAVGFILAMGAVLYWIVGVSRKSNDFFIATEGEMKKVGWSSRKDVVRSTKVVIVSVILLGAFLFVVDLFFIVLFSSIGVLEGYSGLEGLLGIGS